MSFSMFFCTTSVTFFSNITELQSHWQRSAYLWCVTHWHHRKVFCDTCIAFELFSATALVKRARERFSSYPCEPWTIKQVCKALQASSLQIVSAGTCMTDSMGNVMVMSVCHCSLYEWSPRPLAWIWSYLKNCKRMKLSSFLKMRTYEKQVL